MNNYDQMLRQAAITERRISLKDHIRNADIAAQNIVSKLEYREPIIIDTIPEQFIMYNINDCLWQQQLEKPNNPLLILITKIKRLVKSLFNLWR